MSPDVLQPPRQFSFPHWVCISVLCALLHVMRHTGSCGCREVKIVVEGVDKYNNLFGTIMLPAQDTEESLAEALIKAGYAKVGDGGRWPGCSVG